MAVIAKIAKGLIKGAGFTSVYIFLPAMLLLMISDPFLRYIIGAPFFWSNEITTFLMILLAFSAFAMAFAKGRHVRVTVLFDLMSHKLRNAWWVLISLITAVYVGFIAYAVFALAAHSIEYGTITPTTEMAFFPWYLTIGVALVILLIAVVMFTVKRVAIVLGLVEEKETETALIQLEAEEKKKGIEEIGSESI